MSQTLSYTNSDRSQAVVTINYEYVPAPPVPPPPPTPLFWAGTSYRSLTEASNWPNTRFGVLFYNPANKTPFNITQVKAALAAYPNVLWCVCDKGDPAISVPQLCQLQEKLWFTYDQEPEGDDPATYVATMRRARTLIDTNDGHGLVQLGGKYARYPNVQTPGLYQKYFAGTKDNPVEEWIGFDCYARPGIQFPTTRYATPSEFFDFALTARDWTGVPLAITECARLTIASDTQGTLLAGVYGDDAGYLRSHDVLGISYWPGPAGTVTNFDGTKVDFTPLPAPRATLLSIIRSQA